jgi:hypothetical protein
VRFLERLTQSLHLLVKFRRQWKSLLVEIHQAVNGARNLTYKHIFKYADGGGNYRHQLMRSLVVVGIRPLCIKEKFVFVEPTMTGKAKFNDMNSFT